MKKKNIEINGEENKSKQEKSGENPNDDGAISDSDDEKEKQCKNGSYSFTYDYNFAVIASKQKITFGLVYLCLIYFISSKIFLITGVLLLSRVTFRLLLYIEMFLIFCHSLSKKN